MDSLLPKLDSSTALDGPHSPKPWSHFGHPSSLAWVLGLCIYLTLPLVIIFVVSRIYVRLRIHRQMTSGDYICIVAAISNIALCIFMLLIYVHSHAGHNGSHTGFSEVYNTRNFSVMLCLYDISMMLIKLSLLLFYLNLFHPQYCAKLVIWLGAAVIMVFYTIATIMTIVYDYRGRKGHHTSQNPTDALGGYTLLSSMIQSVFGIVTDFYVLAIPLTMISRLHLPPSKKLGVAGIFLAGFIPCACSLANVLFRFRILGPSRDTTRLWTVYMALGIVELNLGIICCCLPICFVLFKQLAERSRSTCVFIRGYINSYRKNNTPQTTSPRAGTGLPSNLPNFPKPTITRLRSMLRKTHRTQTSNTQTTDTIATTYLELQSIDLEYQAQPDTRSNSSHSQHVNTQLN
ncbi:hypothetical protein F4775DRAFT_549401 [Biscogniauxia sp. FL1348]|nr:hypothetical protein F4775DRAFT_549401 [Biscogniauxia sp. FL1348]